MNEEFLFSPELQTLLGSILCDRISRAWSGELPEEIRLRAGSLPVIRSGGREIGLEGACPESRHLEEIVMRAVRYSAYSFEKPLKNGWLPLPGGGRLGICATVTGEGFRDVSSLCIRLPRVYECLSRSEFREIYPEGFQSTLILSPPGYGKTTLLRSMIRRLSLSGFNVSVADDRFEIAGSIRGKPAYDLGPRTDVLSGGCRSDGMMMLLRSMAPDVIACDEISSPEDGRAALTISHLGVRLLATAHAESREDFEKRELSRRMVASGVFRKYVLILLDKGKRKYHAGVF